MRAPALALLGLFACGPEPEVPPVATDRIEAEVVLEALGDGGASMIVALSTAGAPYELEGQDELVAIWDGAVFTLVYNRFEDIPVYVADFFDAPVDVTATLAFTRYEALDAGVTQMSLPSPIDTVSGPAAASLADTIDLTWEPSGTIDMVSIDVLGSCVEPYHVEVADSGETTLLPGALVAVTSTPCSGEIWISRFRPGTLDDNFGGGSVLARQRRILEVELTP